MFPPVPAHQILARHPRFARPVLRTRSLASEEVLAFLVGSLLVNGEKDKRDLKMKALEEWCKKGRTPTRPCPPCRPARHYGEASMMGDKSLKEIRSES
jgi:hypothetical protein